jgi:hypothetical protein
MNKRKKITIDELGRMVAEGFNEVNEKFDKKFTELDVKIEGLRKGINKLPDKEWVSDELGQLKGSVILRIRDEDKKVNLLIELLHKKNILEDHEIKQLKSIKVFPTVELE